MISKRFALMVVGAIAGCTVSDPSGIAWGNNSSEWANDGDCDDPRFDGPWAHSILFPGDAMRDANDCRQLYAEGKVFLRDDYDPLLTYDNPNYIGPN